MISNKEFNYVNVKADTVTPYPGEKYSKEALLRLKDAIEIFNTYYKNRSYEIIFSNGESKEFEIANSNIAHMTGINISLLTNGGFFYDFYGNNERKASFDVINDITNNIDDTLKLYKENNTLFNFYRIKVRSEIFTKFSNFGSFDFGCLFFDRALANGNGYTPIMKSNHFLFVESDDQNYPYYMMGLADGTDTYVETLFANQNPDKIFKNQTISIPTVISTTTPTEFNKEEISATQKLKMIKSFEALSKKYNTNFDYYHDYFATLSNLAREEERKKILKL